MQMYEVRAIMKYEYLATKDSWEQARLIAYLIAQVNSRKKLKLSDITKFYWEDETSDSDTSMSNADLARLREKAKQYINNISLFI